MNQLMCYESDDEAEPSPPQPDQDLKGKIPQKKDISQAAIEQVGSQAIHALKILDNDKTKQNKEDSSDDSDSEELIGPPVPESMNNLEQSSSEDDELIGPPIPDAFKNVEVQPKTLENEEEDSDEEDLDINSMIPINSNVSIHHGSKAVVALAVDPAGARLASGSVDYDVRFWDFAGMDNSLQSFRTLTPCGNNPIKALNYSATGDAILVISGMSQAKVLDRDGHEVIECVKGDQYVTDMARTKGHIAPLTSGCWHPRIKEEFLTSSEDGTCRLWDVKNHQSQKNVIKCRATNGLKTAPTACTYSRDGKLIATACMDGSIQMWDHRKMFVNTTFLIRNAHQPGSETSCITFSYGGSLFATRGGDETLKLWDLKMLKKPMFVADGLFSRYASTNCTFNPNDTLLMTGISLNKGENDGKIMFFSTQNFEKVNEVVITNSHIIQTLWHTRLQQIFVGCGNGVIKAYFNEDKGARGAKLCASKIRKKKKQVEIVAAQQIITPHALPMFRQEKPKSLRKKMEKDRLDPVKSHRPDLPIKSGQGGRVAASGSTLSSYVIRNLGLSKRVEDDQDPREAILRFAKEAAQNPYWISPAYAQTQPTTIFQSDEDQTEEPATKKTKM